MKLSILILTLLFPVLITAQNKIGFMLLPEKTMRLDHQMHMAGGVFTSIVGYSATYMITQNKTKSAIFSMGLVSLVGLTKELADRKTTGFSSSDFWHTFSGGAVMTIIFIL